MRSDAAPRLGSRRYATRSVAALRTSSQSFFSGRIEKGSSSCTASSSIPVNQEAKWVLGVGCRV